MFPNLFCIIVALFACLSLSAQTTPGKESIKIQFPTEYRWKNKKIPKETKAIRGTAYTVRGKNAESASVKSVIVTTIDKRYYPMKAEGSPEEKWTYVKAACPDAILEVIDRQIADGRTAILYAIQSGNDQGGDCSSAVLLSYVIEGPTALHTIELYIPTDQYDQHTFKTWCDILLQAEIV